MQSTGVTFLTILDRFMYGTLHVYKFLLCLCLYPYIVYMYCVTHPHSQCCRVSSVSWMSVRELEGLLRVAQRQTDKATILNMKKVESHSTFA